MIIGMIIICASAFVYFSGLIEQHILPDWAYLTFFSFKYVDICANHGDMSPPALNC